MTLREFARAQSLDPGNLSRVERSRALPEAPLALQLLRRYGFSRMGEEWMRAVDAYCRELVERARGELSRQADDNW